MVAVAITISFRADCVLTIEETHRRREDHARAIPIGEIRADLQLSARMGESELSGEAITAQGIEDLRAEVEELEGPAREAMAARIKAARELGDLKENAEYHIAKDDQAHLEARIRRLRERLRRATVVEAHEAAPGAFAFGRTAEVLDESNGKLSTWTLVGSTEANLAEGRLSAESPVGRALRDRIVDEPVTVETPRGEKVYRVKRLLD
jgi:transcription elongation factor GreA